MFGFALDQVKLRFMNHIQVEATLDKFHFSLQKRGSKAANVKPNTLN